MAEISFKVVGAYQFTETFTLDSKTPFVHADAGRIAGAWHWTFDDGVSGSCHVNGATANRVTPNGGALFGTMKIDMFEVTDDASRTDVLYLAYESSSFSVEGTTVDITVEGNFIGGAGKYAGASGHLKVRSVNGYIGEGSGTLIIQDTGEGQHASTAVNEEKINEEKISEEQTKAAVDAYFAATQSGDAERWALRFADGAFVEDPVGQPPLRTFAEIKAQGEQFMSGFREVGLYPDFVQVSENRASAKWTGRGIDSDGKPVEFEGINVFDFAKDGKVASLRGYWSPSAIKVV